MYETQLAELRAVFPEERVLFHYFKDRYALMLLSYFVGFEGQPLSTIKQSPFKGLLHKPAVKQLLPHCANGRLTQTQLGNVWPTESLIYRLTLGEWGDGKHWRWQQTSRAGKNVVLQLNFSNRHNQTYYRLLKPLHRHLFERWAHPITREEGQHTLAWARIDLNLEDGEALIEEIQNDWIREALAYLGVVNAFRERPQQREAIEQRWGCSFTDMHRYVNQTLQPHLQVWDEAMLMAAIWYLKEEVGIGRIFYHTFESGNLLKNIGGRWSQPPRSIYSKLPRRFGFTETDERPQFLEQSWNRRLRKVMGQRPLRFYLLEL